MNAKFTFKLIPSFLILIKLGIAQTTITHWDFEALTNSHVANPSPSYGSGTASIVGSMTTSGSSTVQGFGNCNASSNGGTIGWQISSADPGTNESSGVQFLISTSGFSNIKLAFDHRLSNTAPRTRRIQYTTDGTSWINLDLTTSIYTQTCSNQGGLDGGKIDASNPVGNNSGERWTRVSVVDFSTITAVNNNPNFGIRIVAAHYASTGQFRQANSVSTVATSTGTWRFDNITISGTPNPLPIKLLYFDATLIKGYVSLDWATVTEINNEKFEIERSNDGNNFEVISMIPGAGNSNNLLNYHQLDSKPNNGKNYYRLKQTDYDGKFEYSTIREVFIIQKFVELEILAIVINENATQVILSGSLADDFSYKLYNVSGKEVYMSNNIHNNSITLSPEFLSQGIYILKIINSNQQKTVKLVI